MEMPFPNSRFRIPVWEKKLTPRRAHLIDYQLFMTMAWGLAI
jgi:hypothetical protein